MGIIGRIIKYIKYYLANFILISISVYYNFRQPLFKLTEFGIIVACFSGIADQLLGEYTCGIFSELEKWSIRCVMTLLIAAVLLTFCIHWFTGLHH